MSFDRDPSPLELIVTATVLAGGTLPNSLVLEAESGMLEANESRAVLHAAPPQQRSDLKSMVARIWSRVQAAIRTREPIVEMSTGAPARCRPATQNDGRPWAGAAAAASGNQVTLKIGDRPHVVRMSLEECKEDPGHYDICLRETPAAACGFSLEPFGELGHVRSMDLSRARRGPAAFRSVPAGNYSVRILFEDNLVFNEWILLHDRPNILSPV